MALIDDVHIVVKAGKGGDGGTAKKQVFGSVKMIPDGGNGGDGGSVYFVGDSNISDLSEFRYKKEVKAENGVNGQHKDLDGAKGEDLVVKVPFGTTIRDEENDDWVEIMSADPFCVAYGGRGGMGNHDFKPQMTQFKGRKREGEMGEHRRLHLVLNLIADIGLIGLPNAGKSSLLKALTNAVPKVGDYPFTTLEPNLGVVLDKEKQNSNSVILADIPGLIEGASSGKGLGTNFLKHIKKTKILLHCLSAIDEDIIKTYRTVRNELESYGEDLQAKPEILLLTKTDLAESPQSLQKKVDELKVFNNEILTVSIYDPRALEVLRGRILTLFSTTISK